MLCYVIYALCGVKCNNAVCFICQQEYSLAMRLCYTRQIMTHFTQSNPETVKDAEIFVETYFPDGFRTEDAVFTVC